MTRRRPMTPARRDRICLRQYERTGAVLPCAWCRQPIHPGDLWIAEHMVPLALGGADDDGQDNVRPLHPECADAKTAGTDATGYRGDIAAVAKAVRLANGGKKRGPGPKGRQTLTNQKFIKKLDGTIVHRHTGEPI